MSPIVIYETEQKWSKQFTDHQMECQVEKNVHFRHLLLFSFNDAELKAWLDELFESKTKDFYRKGIAKLVERWGKVIDTNGEYIID